VGRCNEDINVGAVIGSNECEDELVVENAEVSDHEGDVPKNRHENK
jgi:hypothetical protein